jgi:hypothetical protein
VPKLREVKPIDGGNPSYGENMYDSLVKNCGRQFWHGNYLLWDNHLFRRTKRLLSYIRIKFKLFMPKLSIHYSL